MSVRIRPINESDKSNMFGVVSLPTTAVGSMNRYTPSSREIFQNEEEKDKRYDAQGEYNRRGYINLTMPVMNYFLGGKKLVLLSRILGRSDLFKIANGDVLYDREADEEVNITDKSASSIRFNPDRHLLGAAYVEYLIEQLDPEKVAVSEIKEQIEKVFSKKEYELLKPAYYKIKNARTQPEGSLWIIDTFYMVVDGGGGECFEVLSAVLPAIREVLLGDRATRLSLCLALMRNSKSVLKDQVMHFLVVLPEGYRPPTETGKPDPITGRYNNILTTNSQLQNDLLYIESSVSVIRMSYKSLVTAVRNLMVDGPQNSYATTPEWIPLADTLTGKKGLIREKMIGVRVDYSARSVIVVDPEMSIDTIGIPLRMAEKLMELGVVQKAGLSSEQRLLALRDSRRGWRRQMARSLMEKSYAIIGRQPTLFYLGIKAFKVKVVEGSAIVLNPLCTPSYNADFDGDQMHAEVPITIGSKKEIARMMLSTENLFYSRSGECHIAPRQEVLHGIWKATTLRREDAQTLHASADEEGYARIYEGVCKQTYNVYDIVRIGSEAVTAGNIALRYALGYDDYGTYSWGQWPLQRGHGADKEVTESWFKKIIGEIAKKDTGKFVDVVNRLTRLGFAVANIFPPNMSVISTLDVSDLIKRFDDVIKEREELYNIGLETETSYNSFYDKAYASLKADVEKYLRDNLDSSCGYLEMIKSGARGSMSNVMQLFGMKGRVMKNDNEAFNAILKHPLASQLSGLEHFVTAYGSRQGLTDKTISTYQPGYLSRQLKHAAANLSITTGDCGTEDGLLIDYDTILQFIPAEALTGVEEGDNKKIREYVAKLLVGRYVVGEGSIIRDEAQAGDIYDKHVASTVGGKLKRLGGLKLRSPITCAAPCCVKCYGLDLATNKLSVPGTPIGYLAAQSIGEPGTQLTMKNFQSGGIAGVKNLTSSFDEMQDYMQLKDLGETKSNMPINYDFISPREGWVRCISRGDGTKRLFIEEQRENKRINVLKNTVLLYEGVEVKDYVKRGESIQKQQGNLNVKEILEYRSTEEAARYLTLKLYDIFQREIYVNLKHFEVIVASMVFYICYRGNEHFKPGLHYTLQEYRSYDRSGCEFKATLHGIKKAVFERSDVLPTLFMEQVAHNMSEGIIVSGGDKLTSPVVRAALGLSLGMGTDVKEYWERRGRIDV